jgi:hypothetical protein
MARGWQSKAVEAQMDDSGKPKKSAAASARQSGRPVHHSRHHEDLLLARTRLLKDIETTENPRYRQFLEASLAAINKQLEETE